MDACVDGNIDHSELTGFFKEDHMKSKIKHTFALIDKDRDEKLSLQEPNHFVFELMYDTDFLAYDPNYFPPVPQAMPMELGVLMTAVHSVVACAQHEMSPIYYRST